MLDIFSEGGLLRLLYALPGLLIGFSFHEFAHAFTAYKLGDPTPKAMGRVTLDPIAHIDPMGFILLILVGFGWAKPVGINPRNFKHPNRDDIIVSLAGPAMNFLLAVIFVGIFRILIEFNSNSFIVVTMANVLILAITVNIGLGIFNLLPVPPLDGSHLLLHMIPAKYYYKVMENYGTINLIMIVLLFTGVFGYIIGPAVIFLTSLLFGLFGIPLNF